MSIEKQNPSPTMGLWAATALVTGNMVGSGIFLLPTVLAQYGSISLIGWLCTATGAILLALLFMRLSKMLPMAGGPYAYTRQAFGDFAGFLVAWGYWIGIWTGNAAIAITGVAYMSVFIPALGHPVYAILTAISMVWILTWINIHSLKLSALVQVITTVLKLLPLLLVGTLGWFFIHKHYYLPFNATSHSNLSAITSVAALTLWAFIGIESATIPATHIKNPQKTIPRATLIGTVLTAFVYMASTMAIIGLLPPEVLKTSVAPFADAARPVLGNMSYGLFAAIAVVACLGTLNGWILLQGQVPMAAAQDRLFPAIAGQLNKAGLPAKGIILSSLFITLLILMNFSQSLVALYTFTILLATLTTLIPYILCAIALPFIFFKNKQNPISKKQISITLVLSILALVYTLWAVYGVGGKVILYGLLLLLSGVPIYFLQKIKKS
jgi:APA family basic amino acid/polyamine antiporter